MKKYRELVLTKMPDDERSAYFSEYRKEMGANLFKAGIVVVLFIISVCVALIEICKENVIEESVMTFFCGYVVGIGLFGICMLALKYEGIREDYGPPTDEEIRELHTRT